MLTCVKVGYCMFVTLTLTVYKFRLNLNHLLMLDHRPQSCHQNAKKLLCLLNFLRKLSIFINRPSNYRAKSLVFGFYFTKLNVNCSYECMNKWSFYMFFQDLLSVSKLWFSTIKSKAFLRPKWEKINLGMVIGLNSQQLWEIMWQLAYIFSFSWHFLVMLMLD